ncbi:MAG: hypothetical protein Q8Q18_01455 [bacterium]|nr:hypothetical protein [bacterium]
MVEYVGGAVWFESREGEGSMFSIAIPQRGMTQTKQPL